METDAGVDQNSQRDLGAIGAYYFFCETTGIVTTSGSPPQAQESPELLTCHPWLKTKG